VGFHNKNELQVLKYGWFYVKVIAMSEEPFPIPPEREQAYMDNARQAVDEAAEPILRQLGQHTVTSAEMITRANNLHGHFTQEMDSAAMDIGTEAEDFLKDREDFINTLKRVSPTSTLPAALRYELSKAQTQKEADTVIDSYAADPRLAETSFHNRANAGELGDQIDKDPDEDE
jgi:hypothetical protein